MKNYGKELILDLHECDTNRFTRENIDMFFKDLCEQIDMERSERYWWDFKDEPEEYEKAPDHLKGISAVQFISTSSITIHTLDILEKVFINIFSCKDFDEILVKNIVIDWFKGYVVNFKIIDRL